MEENVIPYLEEYLRLITEVYSWIPYDIANEIRLEAIENVDRKNRKQMIANKNSLILKEEISF